jgi:YjbE family integral membrane protein
MLEWMFGLFSVILIDLVVSGDNAMVIALASRRLPEVQRKKAVLWGTVGAVALRVTLTVLAVYLLRVPFLQLLGGVFLLWVAIKLLVDNSDEAANVKEGTTFWEAIRTIIVADLVLSLDNVLAVAGAGKEHVELVLIGLAISIPIIVWGSGLILKMINKFPILVYVGAGVLGWTAGSMLISDKSVRGWVDHAAMEFFPIVTTLLVVGIGKWYSDRQKRLTAEQTS